MDYKFISRKEEDTLALAQNIESEKFPGMVICLNGELGSGKTIFVKGFAHALGIEENITSPTFNIVKEYKDGEAPLNHMDVYRLEDNVGSFDFDDYFDGEAITIIEWAELVKDALPDERLDLTFKVVDENTRVIVLTPYGKEYEDLCNAVL